MKGLDTNVLIRYLVADDPKQSKLAAEYIENIKSQGETCLINNIVLCEVVWVLKTSYNLTRSEIITTLELIFKTNIFEFENKDAAWWSVQQMKQGKADFSDYLISRLNYLAGCQETASFDKKLQGINTVNLL